MINQTTAQTIKSYWSEENSPYKQDRVNLSRFSTLPFLVFLMSAYSFTSNVSSIQNLAQFTPVNNLTSINLFDIQKKRIRKVSYEFVTGNGMSSDDEIYLD